MSRRYDPTKTRRHWVYSREDVSNIFDVGDSTITNWINRGLSPIDGQRPQLFSGHELRQFHTRTRWPEGRAPENGRLFCWECCRFRPLSEDWVHSIPDAVHRCSVTGHCSSCSSTIVATVTRWSLPEIQQESLNTAGHSSAVSEGQVSGDIGIWRGSIPPERSSSNLRWIRGYIVFLQGNEGLDDRTVDEHLRSVSRMSAFLGHKRYQHITIDNARAFVRHLRELCERDAENGLRIATIGHTLDRCRGFFTWLQRQPGNEMHPDLPGYFTLSRRERAIESDQIKGTDLTFNQALCLFRAMPESDVVDIRNRAIVAMFMTTGIRIAALISLRGKHVNMMTRWVNQDPQEVGTKNAKHIRSYFLDLGSGLLEAIEHWDRWRRENGFADEAPYFLPDRYIRPNGLGFGYLSAADGPIECWKSIYAVQRIIKDAARAAGIESADIASHDFRKTLHPFFMQRGKMSLEEELALELNFGHTPATTIRKNYSTMKDSDRAAILNELCRRALSYRSELELYLGFEWGTILETDPDYRRAKEVFDRNKKA